MNQEKFAVVLWMIMEKYPELTVKGLVPHIEQDIKQEAIVEMVRAGGSNLEIAAAVHCSMTTIQKACKLAGIGRRPRGLSGRPQIPNEKLISDLQRAAKKLGHSPGATWYAAHGKYAFRTLTNRFGTWNKSLTAAGLPINQPFHGKKRQLV